MMNSSIKKSNGKCDICGMDVEIHNYMCEAKHIYNCPGCGKYRIIGSLNIKEFLYCTPVFQVLMNKYTDYFSTPHYCSFVTYLRNQMWVECLRQHMVANDTCDFVDKEAVLTEAMLREARDNHSFINPAIQNDNAIVALAANDQGLLSGYIESTTALSCVIMSYVNSEDILLCRLIGVDINNILAGIISNHGSNSSHWNFFADKVIQYKALMTEMDQDGMLKSAGRKNKHSFNENYYLTSKGWKRYNELIENKFVTKTAFMAMGFTDKNRLAYEHIFKPAVKACGFDLQTVDEKQNHGSIPDDMELKIKRAPFVLVDISGGNNGAYWEAGYAHGLGKPVIYTCDQSTWDEKKNSQKRHFDILHRTTIQWDDHNITNDSISDKNEAAIRSIKAIIRNNVPGAKLDE